MTKNEAIERVMLDRPSEATRGEMTSWLCQLDRRFYHEVILRHEGSEAYTEPAYTEGADCVLMIPCPYDEVYIHHLYACVDNKLGEIDRYNNSATLFHHAWSEAAKAYHRTHMPLGARLNHVIYGRKIPLPENPLAGGGG